MDRRKKVLYAFYHGSAFGWILVHRLTVHKDCDAYLLISGHHDYHSLGYSMKEYLQKFLEAGFFQGIYTHDPTVGLDGKRFDNAEKVEKEICAHFEAILLEQGFDLKEFAAIYNNTDGVDAFGMYLAMRGIRFTWYEVSKNLAVFHIQRGFFKGRWYSERKGYQEVVFKYKTIMGENEHESLLLLPQSDKSIAYFKGKGKKIGLFDQDRAIGEIPEELGEKILTIFGLSGMKFSNKSAMFLLQSNAEIGIRLGNHEELRKQFKTMDYYCLHIQTAMDYFIPQGFYPILKQHPSISIDKPLAKGLFGNAFATPNLFTGILIRLWQKHFKPAVLLEAKSTFNDMMDGTMAIQCPAVLCFPVFYHKYYLSLMMLNMMKILGRDAGKYFDAIKFERERQGNYFGKNLVADIRSLVRLHFPQAPEETTAEIEVVQEWPGVERLLAIAQKKEVIFFLDIWHEIDMDEVIALANKCPMVIIKLEKSLLKAKELVIDSLEKDYIFAISKDPARLKHISDFALVKNNPTLGTKLICHSISLEQYKLDMSERKQRERQAADLEEARKAFMDIGDKAKALAGKLS